MKLKALAAAVALLAAGNANALVINNLASTGNSQFLFTAYDDTAAKSYVVGLNFDMDTLLANPTGTQTFSLAGLSSFFSGITTANWSVTAGDQTGTGNFLGRRILTSANTAATSFTTTNSGVKNSAIAFDAYVNTTTACTAFTPCTQATSSDPAYAGQGAWSFNWGNNGPSNIGTLANGSELAAWLLSTSSQSLAGAATASKLAGTWKLNLTANTLTYSAAVPVPAAVWLMGSALTGLVSVGRRRKA
ncbi:MAG: VPLPA-CTERM sorting domain-containing protein [Gammaproteobacteria bacterium]